MAAKVPVKAIFTGSDVTSLGEFTSSDTINGSYITDNTIDEANLKISNSPTNGYVLTAQSGASGGMTWALDAATDSTKLPLSGGTMTGNIVMADDTSIGISDSAERIEFDGAGDISVLGANLGIGITAPTGNLHIHSSADHTRLNIDCSNNTGDNWQFQSRNNGEFWLRNDDESRNDIVFQPATGAAEFGASVIAGTDTDTTNTGSVTLDFAANQNFVLTLTGNVTLANPSTEAVGQSGFIAFIQDGTGGRTVALGTDYETPAAAGLTLTATASATDLVPYLVVASNRILLGTPQLAFA